MWAQGVGKIEKLAPIFLARAVLAGMGLRTIPPETAVCHKFQDSLEVDPLA